MAKFGIPLWLLAFLAIGVLAGPLLLIRGAVMQPGEIGVVWIISWALPGLILVGLGYLLYRLAQDESIATATTPFDIQQPPEEFSDDEE